MLHVYEDTIISVKDNEQDKKGDRWYSSLKQCLQQTAFVHHGEFKTQLNTSLHIN
jgi:hypothetical protein